MHAVIKGTMALALAAGPLAALAQTYDIDITMTGFEGQAAPVSFMGSFTFNANGTCYGTTLYCSPGTTPDFTNTNISDPSYGNVPLTTMTGGDGQLVFFGPNGGASGPELIVGISGPLGGSATNIGVSYTTFGTFAQDVQSCGALNPEGAVVTCPTLTLTQAPEIDLNSAASGFTLLLGSLLVLRGRRAQPSTKNR